MIFSSKSVSSIAPETHERTLARFAWMTLACNVGVILWGAYVRATGSGAGCGNHWPLCNGEVLPKTSQTQTLIEFTHRVTSALVLVTVATLLIWCWRRTAKGDWPRFTAALTLILILNEAVLGALLVKFDYVGQDISIARAVFLALHFANTLLLLASLALTAYWLSGNTAALVVAPRRSKVIIVALGLFAALAMGISGSLAALGDTLFPTTSLRYSLSQDFSSHSHFLLRLRFVHPATAVIGGVYICWLFLKSFGRPAGSRALPILVITLLTVQLGLGAINVLLLAPLWLQIIHLLVGDVLWISLVLASTDVLVESAKPQPANLKPSLKSSATFESISGTKPQEIGQL